MTSWNKIKNSPWPWPRVCGLLILCSLLMVSQLMRAQPKFPFLGSISTAARVGAQLPKPRFSTGPFIKKKNSVENRNFINLSEVIFITIIKIYYNLLITVNYRICECFSSIIVLRLCFNIFTQVGRNQLASENDTFQLIIWINLFFLSALWRHSCLPSHRDVRQNCSVSHLG